MILDLRNNGGGVLTSATNIVDEFLAANLPIVKTKGEHAGSVTYRSTGGGILESTKVAVLINANSASASEIVAGALQDNDRGIIIGRRSFGKGLVQEDLRLRDGSNLRLTIARYYTPTGRCIQKPYTGDMDEYYQDQMDRYDNGELYKPDSSIFVDSLKFKTPKGKIVYGGGGIMPDVFVPFDSTGMSFYYTELRYSTSFQSFAFDFVNDKRSKWNSPEQFNSNFTISDDLLEKFLQYAKKTDHIEINRAELKRSKKLICQTLKGEIARQLWVEQGYYIVANESDLEVQKAMKILMK
jgi:carboxyl-terminal processing protease